MSDVKDPPQTTIEVFMDESSRVILAAVEGIRFNPERLAAFKKNIADNAPGIGDATEFLDYLIERAGGRSQ